MLDNPVHQFLMDLSNQELSILAVVLLGLVFVVVIKWGSKLEVIFNDQ